MTWPLIGSEAKGDLVLIQTAQFFLGGGVKGVFVMLTSEHLKEKAGILVLKQGHLRLRLLLKAI